MSKYFIIPNKDQIDETLTLCKEYGLGVEFNDFDVILFSEDEEIAAISKARIRKSMEIGEELGVQGVIFHTNTEPFLTADYYRKNWHDRNEAFFREICKDFP